MDPSSALYNAGAGMTTNLPNRSLRKFRIPICISDHCLDVTSYKTVQVILWQLNCNNEYSVGSKYLFWKEWLMYVKVNFCYFLLSSLSCILKRYNQDVQLKLDDCISKARCVVCSVAAIILLLLHVVVSTSGQQQQHNCQAESRSGQEAETGSSARTPLGTTQLVMGWELSGAPSSVCTISVY